MHFLSQNTSTTISSFILPFLRTYFRFFLFQVRGGIYRQKSLGFSETMRKLDTIYIHPMYDDRNILHDIAIAKVDRPFDMDSFTATVCMPPKVDRKEYIGEILS